MSVRLVFDGLDELRAELRKLPQTLATEASAIVQQAASEADAIYARGIHDKTGKLRRGVTQKVESSRAGVAVVVRSGAPHAYIYDNGTQPRQTSQGWNRGQMPARSESDRMVPIAIAARRRMYAGLAALLVHHGAEVVE